jgi:hypothetical protein
MLAVRMLDINEGNNSEIQIYEKRVFSEHSQDEITCHENKNVDTVGDVSK